MQLQRACSSKWPSWTIRIVCSSNRQCGWAPKMVASMCTIAPITSARRRIKLKFNKSALFIPFCKLNRTPPPISWFYLVIWWFNAYRYFRYLDNRVFVSLANGELIVYSRDHRTSYATKFSSPFAIYWRHFILEFSQTPGTQHHRKRYRSAQLQIPFRNC